MLDIVLLVIVALGFTLLKGVVENRIAYNVIGVAASLTLALATFWLADIEMLERQSTVSHPGFAILVVLFLVMAAWYLVRGTHSVYHAVHGIVERQ